MTTERKKKVSSVRRALNTLSNMFWGVAYDNAKLKYRAQKYVDEMDLFSIGFTPKGNVDYSWPVEHAKESFEQTFSNYDYVDAKAHTLQWYVTGLLGAVVLFLGLFYGGTVPLHVLVMLLPFMWCSAVSLRLLLLARYPASFFLPPMFHHSVDYAEHHAKDGEVRLAMYYACADARNSVIAAEKCGLVRRAYIQLHWALASLALVGVVKLVMLVVQYYAQ